MTAGVRVDRLRAALTARSLAAAPAAVAVLQELDPAAVVPAGRVETAIQRSIYAVRSPRLASVEGGSELLAQLQAFEGVELDLAAIAVGGRVVSVWVDPESGDAVACTVGQDRRQPG